LFYDIKNIQGSQTFRFQLKSVLNIMLSLQFLVLSLAFPENIVALPRPEGSSAPAPARRDDLLSLEDSTATSTIPLVGDSAVTTTVSVSGQSTNAANKPDVSSFGDPIEGTSYFYISPDCSSDKRNMDGTGFANRAEFFKQAYLDAVILADHAQKWPQYGTDASDLYFGLDTDKSQYVDNIAGIYHR
jgi:hypothetical protein